MKRSSLYSWRQGSGTEGYSLQSPQSWRHARQQATPLSRSRVSVVLGAEDRDGGIPRVIMIGRGDVSRRLIQEARHFKVPVERDRSLADRLAQVGEGEEIPEHLYIDVARVLSQL